MFTVGFGRGDMTHSACRFCSFKKIIFLALQGPSQGEDVFSWYLEHGYFFAVLLMCKPNRTLENKYVLLFRTSQKKKKKVVKDDIMSFVVLFSQKLKEHECPKSKSREEQFEETN